MATLKELFMGEFKYGALATDITFSDGDGVTACKADARLYLAFEEYACFLAYYVSEEDATAQKLGPTSIRRLPTSSTGPCNYDV